MLDLFYLLNVGWLYLMVCWDIHELIQIPKLLESGFVQLKMQMFVQSGGVWCMQVFNLDDSSGNSGTRHQRIPGNLMVLLFFRFSVKGKNLATKKTPKCRQIHHNTRILWDKCLKSPQIVWVGLDCPRSYESPRYWWKPISGDHVPSAALGWGGMGPPLRGPLCERILLSALKGPGKGMLCLTRSCFHFRYQNFGDDQRARWLDPAIIGLMFDVFFSALCSIHACSLQCISLKIEMVMACHPSRL